MVDGREEKGNPINKPTNGHESRSANFIFFPPRRFILVFSPQFGHSGVHVTLCRHCTCAYSDKMGLLNCMRPSSVNREVPSGREVLAYLDLESWTHLCTRDNAAALNYHFT